SRNTGTPSRRARPSRARRNSRISPPPCPDSTKIAAWHTRCSTPCMNAIRRLQKLGQSVWLDYVDHELVVSGELDEMIEDGVAGLTSNPTIFEKSIAGSSDYDDLARD